jgi:F-type H+-transporting ATPase subunit b
VSRATLARAGQRLLTAVVPILTVLAPALARAAEEHEGPPDWRLLGLAMLNSGLLVILLLRFTRKPINDFLFARREGIRRSLHEAEERLAAAQRELATLRARVQNMDREAREIRELAQQQAQGERERMAQRASDAVERIRQDAERVSAREIERARQSLREEAAELAVRMADELLRRNLNAADDQRLVNEFVERVNQNGGAA